MSRSGSPPHGRRRLCGAGRDARCWPKWGRQEPGGPPPPRRLLRSSRSPSLLRAVRARSCVRSRGTTSRLLVSTRGRAVPGSSPTPSMRFQPRFTKCPYDSVTLAPGASSDSCCLRQLQESRGPWPQGWMVKPLSPWAHRVTLPASSRKEPPYRRRRVASDPSDRCHRHVRSCRASGYQRGGPHRLRTCTPCWGPARGGPRTRPGVGQARTTGWLGPLRPGSLLGTSLRGGTGTGYPDWSNGVRGRTATDAAWLGGCVTDETRERAEEEQDLNGSTTHLAWHVSSPLTSEEPAQPGAICAWRSGAVLRAKRTLAGVTVANDS